MKLIVGCVQTSLVIYIIAFLILGKDKHLPFYKEIKDVSRQLHRLKTRTCLTRTKLMRKTRRSAPLNQQRRNRSSEQRKFAGGRRERLAAFFWNAIFCTRHRGFTDGVLGPLGIGCCDAKRHETPMLCHPKMCSAAT